MVRIALIEKKNTICYLPHKHVTMETVSGANRTFSGCSSPTGPLKVEPNGQCDVSGSGKFKIALTKPEVVHLNELVEIT